MEVSGMFTYVDPNKVTLSGVHILSFLLAIVICLCFIRSSSSKKAQSM